MPEGGKPASPHQPHSPNLRTRLVVSALSTEEADRQHSLSCARAQNVTHPMARCADCSYGYQDVYDLIDRLRPLIWKAYFLGAMGALRCPSCLFTVEGSYHPDVPLTEACRKCHYPLEDLLNAEANACLIGKKHRCASLNRGIYHFEQDAYGIGTDSDEYKALEGVNVGGASYAYDDPNA